MSERGVFAVDRGIWTDADFAPEPFTEREAFMWLVGEAAWKPHRKRIGGQVFDLARGELAVSVRFLAEAWQWSKSRVHRFIERIAERGIIGTAAGQGATLITIKNYSRFQKLSLPEDAPSGTVAGQQRDKLEDREIREYREEGSEAKASGAGAPSTLDPKTLLYREGIPVLAKLSGKSPDYLRGVVGKWMKLTGNDAGAILSLIERCRGDPAAEPIAYIFGCLKPKPIRNDRQSPHSAMFEALAGLARGTDDPGGDSGDVLRLPDAGDGPGGVSSSGSALFRDDGGVLPFRRPPSDIVLDGPAAYGGQRELRLSAIASATGPPRADRG